MLKPFAEKEMPPWLQSLGSRSTAKGRTTKSAEIPGLEKITLEDTIWQGEDGSLSDELIDDILHRMYSPEEALRQILWAIICERGASAEARQQKAMAALLGSNPDGGSSGRLGRPAKFGDRKILLEMAREYGQFAAEGRPPLNEICKSAIGRASPELERATADYQKSRVDHLCKRFKADRDALMTAVTNQDARVASVFHRHVRNILESMKQLGVIPSR